MNALVSPREFSPASAGEIMETVLIKGDLSRLDEMERARYYTAICNSIRINPLTKPFEYIVLNGKLTLYALKACTDQLRKIHGVSLKIVSHKIDGELYTVHVRAKDASGREDEDFGVVVLPPETRALDRANAILKAVTKAKRRATLSICGLGFLDETEVEDIPAGAKREVAAEITHESRGAAPTTQGQSCDTAAAEPGESRDTAAETADCAAPTHQKPARKRKDIGRETNSHYEAIIKADRPRRAFDRPAPDNPDADREAEATEALALDFIACEHEISCCPTVPALKKWGLDNHKRIAKFSEGEKNGLRMSYMNKMDSLAPHSISQRAKAARGPRYAQPVAPDDGLDIPDYLRRDPAPRDSYEYAAE